MPDTQHCYWEIWKKAAELYGKATSESGNRETFLEMFDKDKEMLIKLGVDGKRHTADKRFGLTRRHTCFHKEKRMCQHTLDDFF